MPSRPPGNSKGRGSAHAAVGEEDLQLAEYQIPILTSGVPVLYDPLGRQIEHPPQRIVVGKAGFVFRDLPELPVQALDDVGRVRISGGYSKKVLRTSQLSSQLLTQEGYCLCQASENRRMFSSASSRVTAV